MSSGWTLKRFWTEVGVTDAGGSFGVVLDARSVKTPAKAVLALPTRALAEAVAAEWRAVEGAVDPRRMPMTRSANAALDKVAPQFDEVAGLIAAYGGSDLLCYRADAPAELVAAQAEAWDPMLAWAERTYGVRLVTTHGIAPVAQPAESVSALSRAVFSCTPFQMTALHDLVSLTGSLVLGLAATTGEFTPGHLWKLSRFDEDWQTGLWGEDEEASAIAERKRNDFLHACHFWKLSTAAPE